LLLRIKKKIGVNHMNRLIIITLFAFLLLPLNALAEIKTVTHTLKQPFGGSQSPDDARTAGIARAKREALEQFGTYIESTTVVKNAQVDSDEILALTAGVTKAEVIKQKNYTDGDIFGIEISVKVEIDTSVLDNSLKRLLEDRNHLKDIIEVRAREKTLLAKITELERLNQQKGKTKQQTETLKGDFQSASRRLTAVEWRDKAIGLWNGRTYSDLNKALEYLTNAVQVDPNYARAFNSRGLVYDGLTQLDRAMADFNQAIYLDPNYATAYTNRGNTYHNLKQFDRAIVDYNAAIRLDPNDAKGYTNRGNTYSNLGLFVCAKADFDQSIHLDPNDAVVYNDRGITYRELKQFDRAILDYDQAIHLDPNIGEIYFNRGNAYGDLVLFQRAIADYDKGIRLVPNNATAYTLRGQAYLELHKSKEGCADLQKACKLGVCEGYETAKKEKKCR
jgi:tetratricopeptide (TPR) repeat protein